MTKSRGPDEFHHEPVALVTGASQGIGEAIAVGMARSGYRLALLSRREDKLRAVKDRWPELHDALVVPADVRNTAEVQEAVRLIETTWGRLDVLVNNAGGSFAAPARELSPNGFLQVVAINLVGPFIVSRAALPLLEKQRGAIVNIGSVAGRDMSPNMVAYGASKAGLVNMTRTLAAEWGPLGIRVNCVAPGPILTKAAQDVLYHNDPEEMDRASAQRAVGRLGMPEDIVQAVLWMVHPASGFVNGTVLYVDGGPQPVSF